MNISRIPDRLPPVEPITPGAPVRREKREPQKKPDRKKELPKEPEETPPQTPPEERPGCAAFFLEIWRLFRK